MDSRLVAVVGAGTMGRGIAQVVAQAGFDVVLIDSSGAVLEQAFHQIRASLDAGVARGRFPEAERTAALARIRPGDDLRSGSEAGLVIEAVPERIDLKLQVLSTVGEMVADRTILATNTSGLSISELQRPLPRPGRLVGMHFFNPVPIMKLVEIVRGNETEGHVVEAALGFTRRLGKEPILVRDTPGFASSRLGLALGLEAMRMLEEGVASAEDIDRAMVLGYRHPMGPLRLTDLVGLDVRLQIAEYLCERLGSDRFRPPEILRRLVREGKLGQKTGEGFYTWHDG